MATDWHRVMRRAAGSLSALAAAAVGAWLMLPPEQQMEIEATLGADPAKTGPIITLIALMLAKLKGGGGKHPPDTEPPSDEGHG